MAGRPTKYKAEYAEQVLKLCKLGLIDKEIAEYFEVDEATINRWKVDHIEFCESIKKGKTLVDADVADRLYQRAMGYEHKEDKMFCHEGIIVSQETTKVYPPDTTAAIFWLKNRQPKKWRDKQEHDLTGNIGIAPRIILDSDTEEG